MEQKDKSNWLVAIGTIISCLLVGGSFFWNLHTSTVQLLQERIDGHSSLPGHPQLVEAIKNVDDKIIELKGQMREIIKLENKIMMEKLASMDREITEIKREVKDMCDLQKSHIKSNN